MNTCSVIIAVGKGLAVNRFFFNRFFRNTTRPFELIIVDNGPTDGTASYLNELPNRKLIRFPIDMGLAKAWNSAVRIASGKLVAFVQTSAVLPPGWLQTMATEAEQKRRATIIQAIDQPTLVRHPNIFKRFANQVQGIGQQQFSSEDELNTAYGGFDLFALTLARRFGKCQIASSTAGCLLVSREILRSGPLFSEGFTGSMPEISTRTSGYTATATAKVYTHS